MRNGRHYKKILLIFSGFLVILLSVFFLIIIFLPRYYKQESITILKNSKTHDELKKAVGPLGIFIQIKDGSWIAIRYTDTHSIPSWSLSIALDSNGKWFESKRHFCGRLRSYRVIVKKMELLDKKSIDYDLFMEKHYQELFYVASAPNLKVARKKLLLMGFYEISN